MGFSRVLSMCDVGKSLSFSIEKSAHEAKQAGHATSGLISQIS